MVVSVTKRILLPEDDPRGVELTRAALVEDGLADEVEAVAATRRCWSGFETMWHSRLSRRPY